MEQDSAYVDYDTFLDPSFSATSFANTLVLATNNASDTPLDLNTPLKRVLFDVQEVDTHIDSITTKSALPLINYTKDHVEAGEHIIKKLDSQIQNLQSSYERLEREVIVRHENAAETKLAAQRLWQTAKLARSVGRCMALARQLEAQMSELRANTSGADKENHSAMVRGANTLLSFRQIQSSTGAGEEAEGLERIHVFRTVRDELVQPAERSIQSRAEQIVGQFSMASLTAAEGDKAAASISNPSFAQAEDTKSRSQSALVALYLLSPVSSNATVSTFEPNLLITSLQEYLKRAISSSLAGLTSALSQLPRLERALLEVSARCQNIAALEMLLASTKPPQHPFLTPSEGLDSDEKQRLEKIRQNSNLLKPLLTSLDTSSLPSYFWRSMASQMSSRVQRIMRDGGVSARTLRSNRDRVRDALRECVNRGSQLPVNALNKGRQITVGNWEREAAVMVGSVVNQLGR